MTNPETFLAADAAHAEHASLQYRRNMLETRHAHDGGFEFDEPDYYLTDLPGGHALLAVDMSIYPGGAFKYVSAWGGLAGLPEGTETVVTASAGNYSKTLAQALPRYSLHGTAFTPEDLNPVKRQGMEDAGMTVVSEFKDVSEAVTAARAYAHNTAGVEFLHPYDNRWGIAAMTKLGGYVLGIMDKLEANGNLDLTRSQTQVLSPIGGGSLTAAMASEMYERRLEGTVSDAVSLHGVRPQRVNKGELDARFDGLKVEVPGSHALPLLEDRRFVQGVRTVSAESVADATRLMAGLSPVEYEANALVSVAAAHRWAVDNPGEAPRAFVALVTGRNSDPDQYQTFKSMPGYEGSAAHDRYLADCQRRLGGAALWSAFQREVTPTHEFEPTDPQRAPGAGCLNGATIRGYVAK